MHSVSPETSSQWVRLSLDLIARARLALKEGRDRRLLQSLNDHMLADIGLSHLDLGWTATERPVQRQ